MLKTVALAAVALASAAMSASSSAAQRSADAPSAFARAEMQVPTLIVRNTRFGRMLFDGKGRALYAFTRDRRGGPSRCYGACAAAWPVYFARGTPVAGRGVNKSMIGTTRRRSGRLQVTYNGWPLYYYAHEGRGEVKCQNVTTHGGTWLVVRPNGTLVR
jgi:predicted lipoprotein with Yx(FWY)xxD motif